MDFIDQIRELAERALDLKRCWRLKKRPKTGSLCRLFACWDMTFLIRVKWCPNIPLMWGTKKGEKVDYAIFKDGSPAILFECKAAGVDLDSSHANQLYRYFSAVQAARFGVLTNGISYCFFSDIEAENRMDDKPFLELNLLDIRESLVNELKKFAKESFDVDNILSTASELKYTREIKHILAEEYEHPTEDLCVSVLLTFILPQKRKP